MQCAEQSISFPAANFLRNRFRRTLLCAPPESERATPSPDCMASDSRPSLHFERTSKQLLTRTKSSSTYVLEFLPSFAWEVKRILRKQGRLTCPVSSPVCSQT